MRRGEAVRWLRLGEAEGRVEPGSRTGAGSRAVGVPTVCPAGRSACVPGVDREALVDADGETAVVGDGDPSAGEGSSLGSTEVAAVDAVADWVRFESSP